MAASFYTSTSGPGWAGQPVQLGLGPLRLSTAQGPAASPPRGTLSRPRQPLFSRVRGLVQNRRGLVFGGSKMPGSNHGAAVRGQEAPERVQIVSSAAARPAPSPVADLTWQRGPLTGRHCTPFQPRGCSEHPRSRGGQKAQATCKCSAPAGTALVGFGFVSPCPVSMT